MLDRADRNLKSSMPGRLPATTCTGAGAASAVTGTRSSVPLSVLEAHTAPCWKVTPLMPKWPGPDCAGARAWLTSHFVAVPPEAGTDQMVPARLSAEYSVWVAGSMVSPLRNAPGIAAMRCGAPPGDSRQMPDLAGS